MNAPQVAPNGTGQLVQRASGLHVPLRLAGAPDASKVDEKPPCSYDPDDRLRVVRTKDSQRQIDRALLQLKSEGLAVIVFCREDTRPDGRSGCGQPMMPEGINPGKQANESDAGYGCRCRRLHFID